MSTPLLTLKSVCRDYPSGDATLRVLDDITLEIETGEMVAIIGPSGSGKSTLMNLIGCLDQPSSGSYQVAGVETGHLSPDELAFLRREHFGFIFQRYHLLNALSARENVEIPSIYAGANAKDRAVRAGHLLTRLGMADRLGHRPGQLSGGQQQRVSIARALINGGDVILADEPTGALDSGSSTEVMQILKELHQQGHTIILVTHDQEIAAYADRVIELSDGRVVADRQTAAGLKKLPVRSGKNRAANPLRARIDRFVEAFKMALRAMASHRLRTILTMLGIIIGIASVVSVVALGEGSRQRILSNINAIGTNTISIFPGSDFGDLRSGRVETLRPEDAEALAKQPFVDTVTPVVSSNLTIRFRSTSVSGQVSGVGEQYFSVRGLTLASGRFFDLDSIHHRAQEVVIDENTRSKLFDQDTQAVGSIILLGNVPCRVIGVAAKKDSGFGNNSLDLWVPYTTALGRMFGPQSLRNITVRVPDDIGSSEAESAIVALLTRRHGSKDFFVSNMDTIRQTIEKTTRTMTLLISSIALISLVVGGIGVMNIMLVSVTERTKEIGVRMAVGARRSDIMQQFLIEAVLVCLLGGLLGVALALGGGTAVERLGSSFSFSFSTTAIISAFCCSTAIGVLFGFLPARNASRLNPVDALSRE